MYFYGKLLAINLYCFVGILEYFLIRIAKLHVNAANANTNAANANANAANANANAANANVNAANANDFDNTAVVITVELSKLIVCIVLYYFANRTLSTSLPSIESPSHESSPSITLKQPNESLFLLKQLTQKENLRWGLYYLVPAGLYALYNNLTLFNLGHVEPSTFQIFMQSRLFITAILVQILFRRNLSLQKWCALVILVLGIALKNYQTFYLNQMSLTVIAFIMLQAFLSSIASVTNEVLFKTKMTTSIFVQNGYLYLFGIIFNGLFYIIRLYLNFTPSLSVTTPALEQVLVLVLAPAPAPTTSLSFLIRFTPMIIIDPFFWGIVICGTIVGLCASFIIKYLDTIVKSVYSTLEISVTAIISCLVLGTRLEILDISACVIVSAGVFCYSINFSSPSHNLKPKPKSLYYGQLHRKLVTV